MNKKVYIFTFFFAAVVVQKANGQNRTLPLTKTSSEAVKIDEYPTLSLEELLRLNDLENKLDDVVKLVPNPSTGRFTIRFLTNHPQSVAVTIRSTDGQLIYQNTLYTQNRTNQLVVEDAKLKQGIYLLQLNMEDIEVNRKLIMY